MELIVTVRVKPGSDDPRMEDGTLVIFTREKFERGMANRDVIRQIASLYGVNSSDVVIKRGLTSRKKIVEIKGM